MTTEEQPGSSSSSSRRKPNLRRQSSDGIFLYQVLEVPKDSTDEEIKKAYYKLALKYHPDKNPDNPAACEKIRNVNHAYGILKDPEKRQVYDRLGSVGLEFVERFGLKTHKFIFSKWFRFLLLCSFFTSCFCCCCFCCFCFCCNCCCGCFGMCPESDDDDVKTGLLSIEELEAIDKNDTDENKKTSHLTAPVSVTCKIVEQHDVRGTTPVNT